MTPPKAAHLLQQQAKNGKTVVVEAGREMMSRGAGRGAVRAARLS